MSTASTPGSWPAVTVALPTSLLPHPKVGPRSTYRWADGTRLTDEAVHFQANLLDTVGQAVIAVDTNRIIIYWNRAAEELYGWSAEEAVGQVSVELLPRRSNPDLERDLIKAISRGQSFSVDVLTQKRDGTPLAIYVTNTPVYGAGRPDRRHHRGGGRPDRAPRGPAGVGRQ